MMRIFRAFVALLVGTGAGALLVVGVASPAAACSCAVFSSATTASDADTAFARSDVVFVGRLVGREDTAVAADGRSSSGDPATLTFAVSAVHKGRALATQTLRTARSSSSCGLELSGEGPFLVFADRAPDGALTSSLCSGSTDRVELATWPGAPPAGTVPTPTAPTVSVAQAGAQAPAVAPAGAAPTGPDAVGRNLDLRAMALPAAAVLLVGVVLLTVGIGVARTRPRTLR